MDSLAVTFDEIRDAYGLGRGGPPTQISERVWHLPTASGAGVAVKLYALEHDARAAKETAVLAHLETHVDTGFHVQTLKRTTSGESLWSGQNSHAMLTRWEAGQFKTYDTFSPAEWGALGASLAALHLSLERLHLPSLDTIRARLTSIDADAVRRGLLDALDRADANAAAPTNLRRYVDLALRMLDRYYPGSIDAFPADDPQHPIHNDYNQFNYLFTGTLPPLILDWEAAIGAPREYELVRCLNHLPLEAPQLAQAFVRAYLRVRPVDPARIAWAVDAACLQHALKLWIVQGWLDDPSRFASHLNGAVTMASAMVDARGRLVDFFSRCIEAGR
ncbi:aminoglycoside phosphotransferase [Burkholderia cepacia]|uniref:Aminoglycoside phosphotransferase n=1 Tax=Burkholderia cepacia TaxID=292 RepID=A0A104AEH7_BURCE|nr:phosphotransferase [Burkholderia cepacia]KVH40937.1 aminoglycoside phosphotransferase [Burkholderia cepacia]KVK86274.1 aminoglycoside phosphotransferase [Burkholderia cepacia]KVK96785.1 aminoglycoside phosphotransferase [Burkholderia cepacia]KVL58640.1 aminoglycoside phosphotransferase [Burkholderia cepacia]